MNNTLLFPTNSLSAEMQSLLAVGFGCVVHSCTPLHFPNKSLRYRERQCRATSWCVGSRERRESSRGTKVISSKVSAQNRADSHQISFVQSRYLYTMLYATTWFPLTPVIVVVMVHQGSAWLTTAHRMQMNASVRTTYATTCEERIDIVAPLLASCAVAQEVALMKAADNVLSPAPPVEQRNQHQTASTSQTQTLKT